jgi:uncharacterized membrane protein YcaP (DUF421 family)
MPAPHCGKGYSGRNFRVFLAFSREPGLWHFIPTLSQSGRIVNWEEEATSVFNLSIGIEELVARVVLVYAFLFILLRIVGKRHVGEMAPFDLLVVLILSESVQNALLANEMSVTGGFIASATLLGLSFLASFAAWHSQKTERLLEGVPQVLVHNGVVCKEVMQSNKITQAELLEAMRKHGCASIRKVHFAILENDGKISVGLREKTRAS